MENLVQNIKTRCTAKGISVHQLEKSIGIGNGAIARWGGDVNPGFASILSVASFFGCTVDDLLKDPMSLLDKQ